LPSHRSEFLPVSAKAVPLARVRLRGIPTKIIAKA
jgi:hypothetical protein